MNYKCKMTNISQRIQTIMNHYKLNAGDFANRLGVQKSSISHLVSGRNKPSFLFINKLATALPDVDITWFVTGKGNMLRSIEKANSDMSTVQSEDVEYIRKKDYGVQTAKKKSDSLLSKEPDVKQIVIFYTDDTFKILKKSNL